MRYFILFTLLFSFATASAGELDQGEQPKDFFVLTIAKSGTGLINKLMRIITKKRTCTAPDQTFKYQPELAAITDITPHFNDKEYPFRHFLPFNALYEEIYVLNPNLVPIVHIRDLRDVCVAITFARSKELEEILGKNSSIDHRLMYVIQHSDAFRFHDCKKNAEHAIEWMKKNGTFVTRFEDIVGDKGGGSDRIRNKTIRMIAAILNIPLSTDIWKEIDDTLFGGNQTFRKGQIGQWKEYFKIDHIKAFKEVMGDLLVSLGYEEDNNW